MINNRFRRQFLLTRQDNFQYAWEKTVVKDYCLYYHPELEFTRSTFDGKDFAMLGSMYDWETPARTNQQLLDTLACHSSFENFLAELSKYAGYYVILYHTMMLELSSNTLKLPINPCLKKNIIRLMKRLRVYHIYRNLGLKYRFLKF